jgi:hypothetical protein
VNGIKRQNGMNGGEQQDGMDGLNGMNGSNDMNRINIAVTNGTSSNPNIGLSGRRRGEENLDSRRRSPFR